MKKFWAKLIEAMEESGRRRAAERLAQMGYGKEARQIILNAENK
jgi:hypothetical protein